MSKHTPGPWYNWENEGALGVGKNHSNQADLLRVVSESKRPIEEDEANMRLVAAAPDLLEALESIITNASPSLFSDGQLNQALAAIARAKGKSQ